VQGVDAQSTRHLAPGLRRVSGRLLVNHVSASADRYAAARLFILVLERRFADHWEAIKEIHRRHPRYDGRAGPRDQTLYFFVRMSPAPDGGYDLVAEGSLGRGSGHETAGGGGLVLELASARKGWFVPFDTIRIRQERPAVEGRVQESVELLSKGKGREVPFMKMEEEGLVYLPVRP
jgi:hypothetical protein